MALKRFQNLYNCYPTQIFHRRNLSSTASLLKKKGGNSGPTGSSEPGFDVTGMKNALEATLKQFSEKIKEAKANSVNSEKFQTLSVDLGQGASLPIKSLATIASRGNKINIVAFDPKQVKRIQTAIVSQLGMPAELSNSDKQTLSVTVPQQTDEKKTATTKLIKEAFENLRNNASNKHSLASIRSKYLNPLKKAATKSAGVSKDDVKKQTQEIEQLSKTYMNKLMDLYKKSS